MHQPARQIRARRLQERGVKQPRGARIVGQGIRGGFEFEQMSRRRREPRVLHRGRSRAAPNALPDDPRTAGLFHTAFLQPTRADLARWLVHVANTRVPLSARPITWSAEAIYLDDPEGNGIEVYRDRLPEEWTWSGDRIKMATDRLDLDNLAADAGNIAYAGAPGALRIGHIHLRVGDLAPTQQFYGAVGMMPTAGRGGALFMSSGRYHHHIGSNIWQSAGAGRRDDDRAGLSWFAIEAADTAIREEALARLKGADIPVSEGSQVRDPFGTRVRFA